jgi:hypothetical protein
VKVKAELEWHQIIWLGGGRNLELPTKLGSTLVLCTVVLRSSILLRERQNSLFFSSFIKVWLTKILYT